MKFQPGQSGNPNGRPPVGRALADAIRTRGGPDAKKYLDALEKLAFKSKQPSVRLAALELLLNRGYGKTPDVVEHTGQGGGPVRVMFGGRYKPPADAA